MQNLFGIEKIVNKELSSSTESVASSMHFMEIGKLSVGAVFGLGEEMIDRAIVANSCGVQCFMIPRYWLLIKKQNAGNIWNRIKIYLNQTIPSRQHIFNEYVKSKKWKKKKEKMINNIMNLTPTLVTTNVNDVPLMCRIDHFY